MSSLNDTDKRYLEHILGMGSGYVLDYSDATFGQFFRGHGVDIHGPKYRTHGSSKAKKLRSFWEQEPDPLVGRVLTEMLESYVVSLELAGKSAGGSDLGKAQGVARRLLGRNDQPRPSESGFLQTKFVVPNLDDLPVEPAVLPIVRERLEEATRALEARAHLAVVFLCGSVLEGILLGCARQRPALFNRSSASPRAEEKVKPFHTWTLAQLIDVATDVGVLKQDVKRFGHSVRHFRNYIHPYEQLASGFTPDEHTANMCLQVLKAAIASVAGKRP